MALGYLFSKSRYALNAFLKLIGVKVAFDKCIVDCEAQRKKKDNNDRIDILLRLYQDKEPVKAIIIEAKSVKAKTSEVVANNTLVEGSTSIHGLNWLTNCLKIPKKNP